MKLKGIELEGTYEVIYYDASFVVCDEKGNVIYFETNKGYWSIRECNEKGNVIYYENRNGIIIDERVKEFNEYYESGLNKGLAVDEPKINIDYEKSVPPIERVKELTIEEIEKLLGYKIKIKGERK